MAFSPNYSYTTFSQNLVKKSPLLLPNSQPLQALYLAKRNVYLHKPLHISAAAGLGGPAPGSDVRPPARCGAYEARSQPGVPISIEFDQDGAVAQKARIGLYFATWWALNVVFNIYNKKVLNAFPFPWLTSTLSLAAGSLIMLLSWASGAAEAPETDAAFWRNLLPVAVAHTVGHVAATVSMAKVAVSFTHIIKSGEPAFTVLVSSLFLGETFPLPVYLSLLPIIGGCALSAATELNFNLIGKYRDFR